MKDLIKFLFARKFSWTFKCSKIDILVFDKEGSENFIEILPKYNYFILKNREVLYIKYLIKSFNVNLNFRQWQFNYYCRILEDTRPKLVMTFIDNNSTFWNLDKKFSKTVNFLAIQNANRWVIDHQKYPSYLSHFFYDKSKKNVVYHSNFACVSEHDMDMYNAGGIQVENYHPIGSLSIDKHIKNYQKRNKIFDICLVANSMNDRPVNLKIMEYLVKYVEENDVSACVALKKGFFSEGFKEYFKIFDQYFGNSTVVLVPHKEAGIPPEMIDKRGSFLKYTQGSQYLSDISRVTIGFTSTLLRQTFSRGNKIYPINFEIIDIDSPFSLLNTNLRPQNYEEFSNQLTYLINLDDGDYQKNNKKLMRYFDIFDVNSTPSQKLKNIIDKLVG
jgi:hypothetical protein